MLTIQNMHASCAHGLVVDDMIYSIAPPPPPPSPILPTELPNIPGVSFAPMNTVPRVSPVRKPHVTRTLVRKPIVKRKRDEWMEWINWNLAEENM